MRMPTRLVCLCAVACAFLQAQTFRGKISGSITDASGAAVPGAVVKMSNEATGLARATLTTESGEFSFPELPLGFYSVTVSKDGFQIRKVEKVEAAVSKVTNLTIALDVSSQVSTVEVQASAVTLETNSSALAGVVGPRAVQDLPMNGRDFRQMLKLTPGVSPSSGSVNGMRTSGNNYQIDGADNNDAFHNSSAVNQGGVAGIAGTLLPVEAIDQFSVVSGGGADFGRNGGSNVNLVIKSGTNTLHGSAFYFNRNEYFSALSPFAAAGSAKRVMRNDQYGFSLGGPAIKNKLFYFVTGETQKAFANLALRATHPSDAWVASATTVMTRYGIPVNSVSRNLLKFWPSRYNTLPAEANNLLAGDRNDYDSYNGIIKVDYAVTSNHNLSMRYFGGTGKQAAEAGVPSREYFQVAPSRMHNIATILTSTLSNRAVNQLLLGANYFLQVFNDLDTSFDPIAAGLNTGVTEGTLKGSPSLRISNFAGASATQPLGRIDTTGHITDNLSLTVGRHQLKFGGEYRRAHLDVFYDTNKRGSFSWDGTRGPWAADASVSAPLKSLADFLAGLPTNNNGASIVRGQLQRDYRQNSFEWWVHDNFQVSQKLNLNFGVRYTYHGVLYDTRNSITNFIPGRGFVVPGKDIDRLYPRDLNNLAPRFGFAYNLFAKTVVRGSWGLFYDVPPLNFIVANTGVPNGGSAGVHANPAGPDPVYTITRADNLTIQPGALIFPNVTPTNVGAFGISQDFRVPYVQNYNLNVQHQISKSTLVQVGYVGSAGRKLSLLRNINAPTIGAAGTTAQRRPYFTQFPSLASINELNSIGTSNYNSMQLSLRQTSFHGFSFNANYTLGHSLDYGSNVRNALPANSYDLSREKGSTNFDIRHIFTGFASYELPKFTSKMARLTQGWQLNGLFTAHTGEPLDILAGRNVSNSFDNRDRVDVVGDPLAGVAARSTISSVPYFNPAAFAFPATGQFGNIGRNSFYGPGFGSFDFSVFKDTRITEKLKAQFRLEIFNITNRSNYANPGTSLNSTATLGLITSTRNGGSAPGIGFGEPRNVQLALKLVW